MYSLDQESLERVHLKDSRGYAGDDSASNWLPNINKCHPPRFSRTQPAPVDPILQTTTAKRPHTNLFLPCPLCFLLFSFFFFFTSLLHSEGWNLENRVRPVLTPSSMWRRLCVLTKNNNKNNNNNSKNNNNNKKRKKTQSCLAEAYHQVYRKAFTW